MKPAITKKAHYEFYDFGDEGVILYDTEAETNIIMNRICYMIWELCDKMSIKDVALNIWKELKDGPSLEKIEGDVEKCISEFEKSGLIAIKWVE